MTSVRRLLAICLLILMPVSAWAQPAPAGAPRPQGPGGGRQQNAPIPPRDGRQAEAPRGTAAIRGIVVAADNGTPVRRAQIRASAPGAGTRVATTDAQGRFEIRELAAGRYTVSASKAGFVALQYGQRRPAESGTPIEIGDGQMLDKLVIALPRGSVISGRITDEFGEPVANALVMGMRYGYVAGAKRLMPAPGENTRDTTDDQGQFRLFGLSPGEYVVSATLRTGGPEATDPAGETPGYAPTYFPGTGNVLDAQRIALGLTQEQAGVSFSLLATRLVRVSGAILNSQGAPATGGMVMLTPAAARIGAGAMMQTMSGRVEQGGQFRITGVPPGRYLAQVRAMDFRGPAAGRGGRPMDAGEIGRQEVTVGGEDLDGLVIITAPGGRVTGQIVVESGTTAQLRMQQVSVTARAADVEPGLPAGNAPSRVNDDGTFEITNVFDPRLFRVNLPQGWNLKSITLNGQDITDTPVDIPPGQTLAGVRIVLTDKSTEVSGRVTDIRGDAVTDATVIVFPADDTRWTFQSRFVRTARPDLDGRYQIRGLPPLDKYLVVAVQGLEDGQASNPEYLATIREAATSFSLTDAQTRVMDLRWR